MKKFLKVMGILLGSVVVLLYLAFLFVLPNVIDLNKYLPELQKIVKEQTNLTLDLKNPKISVTPLLAAGVSAEDISVKLPDNSNLLTADSFKGRISLPYLLLLTVKVSTLEVENPLINVDIVDGKAFKAVDAYNVIINSEEENIEENLQTAQEPIIDMSLIKILVPAVKIHNYTALVNDLKTGNFLKLKGDELVLGYKNGKTASIKTNAQLFVNDTKNINANIDIDTIIPAQTKLDDEDDKAQKVEIPFVNPVAMYMAYDLKTNVDSKIKIRSKHNQIVSRGYFNVDNFTLKLAGLQLPESKFHIKTRGTKADIDSDLFITDSEKLSLLGMLNYGKNPATDIKISSNEIHLDNVISLIKATLDSLHIQNELAPLKGEGYFVADTYIKTNFKKLKSQGNITIKDCIVKNTQTNTKLAQVNSIISLDNSILKFVDTTVEFAQTMIKIAGTINEKSYADISVIMEKLPLQKVFTMFMPSDINKTYNVNSGDINLTTNIKGELKKATGTLKLSLNNLSLTDKINQIDYANKLLVVDFTSDFKNMTGKITNNNFQLTLNGASLGCDNLVVTLGEKDITIDPSKLNVNNSTDINFEGSIKNYIKNPIFNFGANGYIKTQDIKQFLGSDVAPFIKEKGAIPLNATLTGDSKKQTLTASIDADSNNYITPIDIKNVLNKNTTLKTVIDFKGDRLKIKDTGFYIKTTQKDPKDETKTIAKYDEVVGIEGTITKLNTNNPNINIIKVKIPNSLNATICAFPQSKLDATGHLYVFGDLASPRLRGNFNLLNISIPELLLSADKAEAKFEGKNLDVELKNILANGSDYNILLNADLNPSDNFIIKNINVISKLTDADKLMKVSDLAMKYVPASSSSSSTASSDIPVIIQDGSVDIKEIKTGNITLTNTTSKLALAKNILYVKNIITSAFKGTVKGDVSVNLIDGEIKTLLKGNNLDVAKTLLDAAAMKDTLTGTMDFDTNVSLKGQTYEEQMKTLKGDVNFVIKNGTLGPFGKLENLILAENIRESSFFQSTIGSVLNSLLSFDTTHFNTLTGNLSFKDGITDIKSIKSEGDIMATYIFGNFDLLKNTIDIKLRGRLGSQVSDSMGMLSLLNPINLVKATPGMSLVMGKVFFLFTEVVTTDELNAIPTLGKDISDTNTTKFQVVVRGDVAKPLTLVKSFKWLALESDMENAQNYLKSIPEDVLPVDITTINTDEIKTQVKEQATQTVKDTINNTVSEETKQTVEQTKDTFSKIKSLFKNKEQTKTDVTNAIKEQAQQLIEEATKTEE